MPLFEDTLRSEICFSVISYQFYSRGFGVEFGKGDANLKGVVDFLKDLSPLKNYDKAQTTALSKYTKWLIVEQDKVEDPVLVAEVSKRWLATSFSE